jgi:opacity protein-like surface antigen
VLKRTAFIAVAVCLLASSAFAQATDQPRRSSTMTRGYIEGIGGLTFGTESDGMFAAEVGIDLSPSVEVYGSIGRMQNIAPSYINEQLDVVDDLLTAITGQVWDFNVKAPSLFGVGGLKMRFPTEGSVRPYVLGGAGFGSIDVNITEIDLGDVTETLLADGYLLRDDIEATKFMFEVGGGIEIPIGAMHFDVGYRFGKFVGMEDANVSRAYGGLGYRFGR